MADAAAHAIFTFAMTPASISGAGHGVPMPQNPSSKAFLYRGGWLRR